MPLYADVRLHIVTSYTNSTRTICVTIPNHLWYGSYRDRVIYDKSWIRLFQLMTFFQLVILCRGSISSVWWWQIPIWLFLPIVLYTFPDLLMPCCLILMSELCIELCRITDYKSPYPMLAHTHTHLIRHNPRSGCGCQSTVGEALKTAYVL